MRKLLMLCLLAAACSDDPTEPAQNPSTNAVDVRDNSFSPATQTTRVGQTIRWTWRGNNPHNVTFTGVPASATQSSGTFERTFGSTGTFSYLCTVHGQSMSGTITVTQ